MDRMIEKAKEELQFLETHHPNTFDYLKVELKSFIAFLQSQILLDPLPTTSSATTQASTSMKMKRKRESLERRKIEERWKNEEIENGKKKMRMQRDRVDVVLEKAEACLRKIQDFKFSLVC